MRLVFSEQRTVIQEFTVIVAFMFMLMVFIGCL
jgi:hypothetical protein